LGREGAEEMSEDSAAIERRVRRAAKLLFYKRHRQPGVRGWELRRALGGGYPRIIELLNERLEALDLQVRTVNEAAAGEEIREGSREDLDRARFYVTLRGPLSTTDLIMSGWRVDDVAALIVAVALIVSRGGKAARTDVEAILREKLPGWRIEQNLNRFVRLGYLAQEENGILYVGWRSRAEIDEKLLLRLILGEPMTVRPTQ
jgi:hypothetical protein